jgi:hypothetical protein
MIFPQLNFDPQLHDFFLMRQLFNHDFRQSCTCFQQKICSPFLFTLQYEQLFIHVNQLLVKYFYFIILLVIHILLYYFVSQVVCLFQGYFFIGLELRVQISLVLLNVPTVILLAFRSYRSLNDPNCVAYSDLTIRWLTVSLIWLEVLLLAQTSLRCVSFFILSLLFDFVTFEASKRRGWGWSGVLWANVVDVVEGNASLLHNFRADLFSHSSVLSDWPLIIIATIDHDF